MVTYRKCQHCGEYYSDRPPLTPNPYCPLCFPKKKKKLVKRLKKWRYVPMEYFNLYTDEIKFKNGFYGHACRVCGKPIQTKKGMPGKGWFCHRPCNAFDIYDKYDWGTVKDNITQTFCDICGKESDGLEVHHKKPVHTLTWANIHLIWDPGNLVILCHSCHMQQPHYRKVKNLIAQVESQTKITGFMHK